MAPDTDKIGERATESKDVNRSGNGLFDAKVERCPQKVQGELDGVESRSVLYRVRLVASSRMSSEK